MISKKIATSFCLFHSCSCMKGKLVTSILYEVRWIVSWRFRVLPDSQPEKIGIYISPLSFTDSYYWVAENILQLLSFLQTFRNRYILARSSVISLILYHETRINLRWRSSTTLCCIYMYIYMSWSGFTATFLSIYTAHRDHCFIQNTTQLRTTVCRRKLNCINVEINHSFKAIREFSHVPETTPISVRLLI